MSDPYRATIPDDTPTDTYAPGVTWDKPLVALSPDGDRIRIVRTYKQVKDTVAREFTLEVGKRDAMGQMSWVALDKYDSAMRQQAMYAMALSLSEGK